MRVARRQAIAVEPSAQQVQRDAAIDAAIEQTGEADEEALAQRREACLADHGGQRRHAEPDQGDIGRPANDAVDRLLHQDRHRRGHGVDHQGRAEDTGDVDLAQQEGFTLVIVIVPTKEEVYRQWTEVDLGKDHIDKLTAGRVKMLELCHGQNLLCVDAYEAFTQRATKKELLYWPADIHLNPAGNQVLSDVVWDYLVDQSLAAPN